MPNEDLRPQWAGALVQWLWEETHFPKVVGSNPGARYWMDMTFKKKGKKEINKKAIELKKYEFIVKERKRRKKVRYKASVIGLKSSIIFEMPSLTLLHDGWSHRIKINVKRLMLDQAKAAKCNNVAF